MSAAPVRALAAIGWAGLALVAGGCVSAKHQLTRSVVPPTPLDLLVAQPPVGVKLHAVIVQRGPGSWKRDAFWDEYVLSLANEGDAPLTVESVSLIDFEQISVPAGDDPWVLENQTRHWRDQVDGRMVGQVIAIGSASLVTAGAAAASAVGTILGSATTAGVGILLLPLTGPAYVMTSVALDLNGREKVEAEFARRRIALPRLIAPREVAQGSLFFRIAPGPQRLVLRCSAAGQLHLVTLDLAPLAGLHLKAAH